MGDLPFCRCGHAPELHEHYRPGADCGVCGRTVCPGYRRPPGRITDALWAGWHLLGALWHR